MKINLLYELFDRAVQIESAEELALFLDRECLDTVQRQELSELLQAHKRGHRLLDSPTQAMEFSSVGTSEAEGETIANYKLLQKIGEGGMGIVFMAEQLQPIRRKVALKIIREGMNSKQIIARFEAEREALARLDHPNATRILDAGVTPQGRPYFVMDLVRGTHITGYCNTHRLTIIQRLELMEKVCMVIHHAHQKGILHRDIKPSNVMITLHDGVPVPKVIDFGIAKALDGPLTEKTLFTRYGDLVGTPEYMSPEQAEMSGLDLDVRTDIYSLGVLLYELLTGSTPITSDQIKDKGLLKIFETIRDSEAELPSMRITRTTLNETVADQRFSTAKLLRKGLAGDLDWITMKALSKDRNERYDSAAAMAKDLRNFLQGEPVEAAAPSFIYRARKFYRKHQAISVVATVSAALLLTSTALSVYWAIVSADNARRADGNSAQLAEKSQALEAALARALKAEKTAENYARDESRRATEAKAELSAFRELIKLTSDESPFPIPEIPIDAGSRISLLEGSRSTGRLEVKGQIITQNSVDDSAPEKIASSVVVKMFDTKPIRYWDILLEEQRKTFGSQDVFVAETLYKRALSRIEPPPIAPKITISTKKVEGIDEGLTDRSDYLQQADFKPDFVAAENDLREAIAILAGKSEVEIQSLETFALLSFVLRSQGKLTQAAEFSKSASQLIEQLKVKQLTESEEANIKKAILRIEL